MIPSSPQLRVARPSRDLARATRFYTQALGFELLAEFTRRMDASSRKAGAIEFAQAFDEARQEKLPWR